MALIKCSECGKEISEKALSCPNCGNPIKNLNEVTQSSPIVIERTSKRWKLVKLFFALTFLIGGFIFLSNFPNGGFNNVMSGFGFCVAFFGLIGFLIGKFGAWWSNR